jgi:hypothetical protein
MVMGIAGFLFLVLFGVSALIGLSDKGQLDVSSKIADKKESATEEEKQILADVPTVQNAPTVPNGGLVGMGSDVPPPPPPPPAATTTDISGTSTDTTADTNTAEVQTATEGEATPAETQPPETNPAT